MTAKNGRYWGVVTPLPVSVMGMQLKMQEEAGLEGVFAPQVYGPPFLPLAAAAALTTRMRLASGIALAFVRSPFETAMAAMDMDRISGGRFTLGLGCSVRAWSEGFFGMEYGKPLEHMREVVGIIRTVIAEAHTGALTSFQGKYHRHDFADFQPSQPPVRTDLPIWIAALRPPLVSLAAEIADGVMGHPIWSPQWAREQLPPALEKGLNRAGKKRSDIEVSLWPWVAINKDKREAINEAKATLAFYGGIKQYEEYWAAHGFREEARRLQEGVRRGDYVGVAASIPDEMVETFVLCGTPDEVRKRVEPLWQIADSLCPVPPAYALPPDKVLAYAGAIATTFYGG
jgi:probable F420-dependent oxidoreductase